MLKKDVLDYLQHHEGMRDGAKSKLASILNVTTSAISQWGNRIPMMQARRLDKFLRVRSNLKQFDLPSKDRPQFDINDYEV